MEEEMSYYSGIHCLGFYLLLSENLEMKRNFINYLLFGEDMIWMFSATL